MSDIPAFTDLEFSKFAQLIHQLSGIHLTDIKKPMIAGRLVPVFRQHQLSTFAEFLNRLGKREMPLLQQTIDVVTTNETYFFRESAHFDFICREWLPTQNRGQGIRIWSAACSSGQEVYGLAMRLAESGWTGAYRVVGSDLSARVLETAKAAIYPLEQSSHIPAPLLKKYCLRGVGNQDGTFRIAVELRHHTEFRSVNLLSPPSTIGQFDLILLRNVMIYFDQETKAKVVENLLAHLRPGGLLIIGHAETLHGVSHRLHALKPSLYRYSPNETNANRRAAH